MSETHDLLAFNQWFSDNVSYRGHGQAEFSNPPAIASGPTVVTFDESGEANVEMSVESFKTEYEARFGDREVLYPQGRRGESFIYGFRDTNPCVALNVATEDGEF